MAKKTLTIRGPKPAGLSILRDDSGVPHIQANNLNDLNWGAGYCHAIDRGTQLQMMRIIGQGRLCELLDDSDDNLKIDIFFRRMNWYSNDLAELEKLDAATREWCQALCDGINAGLAARKLSLLKLLGYTPEPWRIQDLFLTLRMTSYLTLAQSQAEVERLFIELAQSEISSEKLAEIFPVEADKLDRDLLNKIELAERIIPSDALWQSAAPRAMASNNWVISGRKTKSGAAMMASDPHLEINRLPNVWYELSLSSPDYQGLGFGMPGFPGLLIGRTPEISWGTTYTFMDTVDSWVEHCKDGKYRRGKTWKEFEQREEIIKRKKHADERITFYQNPHGVLDGEPTGEKYQLSTCWSPSMFGAESLNASYALTRASNAEEAAATLGRIESAWNWVIADDKGNIAYQMSGLCPKRDESWNGFTPAPGWDKKFDWQGFEKIEDLPRTFNPDCGYIVTANEDLNYRGNTNPINMPMGDYRSKRIQDQLEINDQHDLHSCRALQMDTYSQQAEQFLKVLLPMVDAKNPVASLLSSWDFRYNEGSLGAPVFEAFYSALREEVFGKEQFGVEAIRHLHSQTGLFIDFYQNFDRCLLNPESVWYDKQTQESAFVAAFERAALEYKGQTWGEINTFRFTNILLQGKAPDWLGFDSVTYPMIGGRATPHQGQIYESAGRKTSFAPSIRIVSDMSERVLHTRIAGGVSDNRLSPWYTSEIDGWLKGSYKELKL